MNWFFLGSGLTGGDIALNGSCFSIVIHIESFNKLLLIFYKYISICLHMFQVQNIYYDMLKTCYKYIFFLVYVEV